jgi:hypothetical protein
MIFEDPESLTQRIFELTGRPATRKPKIFEDTSADLNEILMRFSVGSTCPYQDPDTLLSDLCSLFPPG